MDAKTAMLNKKMDEDEKRERFLGEFILYTNIEEIESIINQAKESAKDYKGYDFTEDLNDMIKEII